MLEKKVLINEVVVFRPQLLNQKCRKANQGL